jgi:L-lactate dehydrogenase complex protein LldG
MSTTTRTEFLSRVKKALGHPVDQPAPSPVASHPVMRDDLVRQVKVDAPNRTERWLQLAAKNGMFVQKMNRDAILESIKTCLAKHQAKKVMTNLGSFEGQIAVPETLTAAGIETHAWGQPGCRDTAYQCDASITDCRYGLADTGALLVWSDPTFGRSSTLTVPVHIILLREERILPDMVDGLSRVRQDCNGQMPSNIVVINGPSKTADIEMNLVTGVHGPKYVYVLVIE